MKKKLLASLLLSAIAVTARPTVPVETFNLSVSLWRNPTTAEKLIYETVADEFAKGVYQATNGGAKIGRLNFYENGNTATNTSVMWSERRAPMAYINGYKANGYILFADELVLDDNGTQDPADDTTIKLFDGLDDALDAQKAGMILAHEFMHYVYGLCDQYRGTEDLSEANTPWLPDLNDHASQFTLMSDFMTGIATSEAWANLDVYEDVAEGHRFEGENAQGRVYKKNIGTLQVPEYKGASSWDVLSQDPTLEPALWGTRGPIGTNQWTSLSAFAPLVSELIGAVKFRVDTDLPVGEEPYKAWVGDQIAIELVVDISGSMDNTPASPTKMEQATAAALHLTSQYTIGTVWSGLISFSDILTELHPMTFINDASALSTLQGHVSGLASDNGDTHLFDAAYLGYEKLNNTIFTPSDPLKTAFILTDGKDNNTSGRSVQEVIDIYELNGISAFTFGFGTGIANIDEVPLRAMAEGTGGKFFQGLTSQLELQNAYADAMSIATGKELIVSSEPIPPTGASYNVGSRWSEYEVRMKNTCPSYTTVFEKENVVQTPIQTGDVFKFDVSGDNSELNWTVAVTGCPSITFDVWKNQSNGGVMSRAEIDIDIEVVYPTAAFITASAYDNAPLTGLGVQAKITSPSNVETDIELNDNGIEGDKIAGDGIYSMAWDGYTEDGAYKVEVTYDNDDGLARTTYNKHAFAHGTDLISDPYTEAYDRVVFGSMSVVGVISDDHGDDIISPSDLYATNSVYPSRLDTDGDIDVFKVINYSATDELVIRVTNIGDEFVPEIRVFDETGIVVIAEYNKDNDCTDNGYIIIDIDPAIVSVNAHLYVSVSHSVSDGGLASYDISAGLRNSTDIDAESCPIRGDIEGVFSIVNVNSDKCVDVKAAGTDYGENVQQWDCNGTGAQKWEFIKVDDTYEIKNVNSGLLLDVAWGGSNENVQQWGDVNSSSQRWRVERFADGIISLRPQSDFTECLDVEARSTTSGANIQSYPCNLTAAQQFKLVDLNTQEFSGNYKMVNINSGKCVEVQGGAQYDGANVQQYNCNGTGPQNWEFTHLGGAVYDIRNIHAGKFLDVAYGGNSDNVQVWWSYPTGSSQQWKVESNGYGSYTLKPLSDNAECLTVQSSATWSGANMQSVSCSSNNWSQLFDILK
ncbi:MAG: RICIN domain-containing protein [Fibrobacterales bacterium]